MDQRRVVIFQQPNINTRHFSTFLKIVFFSFPIRTLRKRKSNLSLTYGRVCCCSFLPYTHICSEAPELKTKQTKKTIKYIPLPMLIQEKKNFNEPVLFHRLEENAQKGYITRLLGHSGRVCHPNFTITNWLCRFSRLNILIFRDGLTIHFLYFTLLSVKIMWSLRENFPIKTFLKINWLKTKNLTTWEHVDVQGKWELFTVLDAYNGFHSASANRRVCEGFAPLQVRPVKEKSFPQWLNFIRMIITLVTKARQVTCLLGVQVAREGLIKMNLT